MLSNFTINQTFTTSEVADNYGLRTATTIQKHKSIHADELIENIHYFYSTEKTNGGVQKVIRWTLEGVYMLGFFIKSQQAKIYRKKVAEFLRLCKEKEMAKAQQLRKDYLTIASRNATLEAIAISKQKHHNNQINGYKSQISQKNNLISELRTELKKYDEARKCQISSDKSIDESLRNLYLNASFEIDRELDTLSFAITKIGNELVKTYAKHNAVISAITHKNERFIKKSSLFKKV